MVQLFRACVLATYALVVIGANAMAGPAPDAGKGADATSATSSPGAASTNPVSTEEATANDVHCLVIYMLMGGAEDAKFKAASVTGTLYFTGKLDGRDPNLDVEGNILSELPKLKGDVLKTEAERCGAELTRRGQNEIAMTQDLQQRVLKMQGGNSPH